MRELRRLWWQLRVAYWNHIWAERLKPKRCPCLWPDSCGRCGTENTGPR